MAAAVPATALGHLAAVGTAAAGAVVSTVAGAIAVIVTFALLARPLRLTELDALLSGVRRRWTRTRT